MYYLCVAMARSSQAERVYRINAAGQLLREEVALAEAVEVLAKRFSVGKRQAYRYLEEACQSSPLSSPEEKAVFTVRLPVGLIEQLRSPSAAPRAIIERLCLPSVDACSRRTKPTTTWQLPLLRNRFRSSLRAGLTGYARTSFPVLIASWFLIRMVYH